MFCCCHGLSGYLIMGWGGGGKLVIVFNQLVIVFNQWLLTFIDS